MSTLSAVRCNVRLRAQSTLRDMAAKAILKSTLDSYSAAAGAAETVVHGSTDFSTALPLRSDIEYDAMTWKSIVVSKRG
jgi:hypothetical protein